MSLVWIVGVAVATVVVFVTGYLLAGRGSPYSTGLLTVHKLVALAAVVATGIALWRLDALAGFSRVVWSAVAVAALLLVATFVTGGVISARPQPAAAVRLAHKVTPWFSVVAVAVTVALVTAGR